MARERVLLAAGLVGAALLSGCAEMHDGYQAVARRSSAPVASADDVATPNARTPGRASAEVVPAEPLVHVAAVPSPRQIFDFHPAGSGAESWRQPFIIDPNDGPLASDVRKTAAELKSFMAAQNAQVQAAKLHPCSETDVAAGKPGCVTPPLKTTRGAAADRPSRGDTALQ